MCLLTAEQCLDRDYGDKKQVRCSRCGQFEISGTALAMLGSRLEEDPLARARLSHAIRLRTSDDNWQFVSSANLDDMVRQPLPGIPQQLQHLIIWIAAQLGDDKLGRIPAPSPVDLAGLIGAADGDRVQRLIDYAVETGVVERDPVKDTLGLSPEGWERLEPSDKAIETDRQTSLAETPSEIIKAHCNTCGGNRSAFKRAGHTVKGNEEEVSWSDTYDVLECCGCSSLSVRHTSWCSEWDQLDADPFTAKPRVIPGVRVTCWPPQTKRKKPDWAERIDDEVLRCAIDEVYQALNHGMIVLASIGTRMLLDRAMFLRIGDPRGGFGGKLDLMTAKGHIGKDEKETLKAITDAGSAAAHRGYAPSPEQLETIVEITENFLHREFVLKTAAGDIRTTTPPRTTSS